MAKMLALLNLVRVSQPISLRHPRASRSSPASYPEAVFADGPRPKDRAAVEVEMGESTFQSWVREGPVLGDCRSTDDDPACPEGKGCKKLFLFSGNDYLGMNTHPALLRAAVKAAQVHGMGPRGSALICGYTTYHMLLESSLADLKKSDTRVLFTALALCCLIFLLESTFLQAMYHHMC